MRKRFAKSAALDPHPTASSGTVGRGGNTGSIFLLLAIVTVITLWPVCTAEFTSWDDTSAISKNPTMLPPTRHSLEVWWTQPTADLWIPITYTTWGAIAAIAQVPGDAGPSLNPYIFHAANLLLHVLAVLVVFELLEILIGKHWPAAAGAALFALHPVQVEPVAWAAGTKDVLYGLLALVAISLIRPRDRRAPAKLALSGGDDCVRPGAALQTDRDNCPGYRRRARVGRGAPHVHAGL
jgi:hypothetical protein